MGIVWRGVDDGLDLRIGQQSLVALRRPARVFAGESLALIRRSRVTADNLEPARALRGVG
jgi:hypothetical protein